MNRINFFTPVDYGGAPLPMKLYEETPAQTQKYQATPTWTQKFETAVDHYFYFGGRIAAVLPSGKTVHLVESTTTIWKTALKAASYVTLFLPALALTTKFVFRFTRSSPLRAIKRTHPNGTVAEGKFSSSGQLVRGVFRTNMSNELTVFPSGFCDNFPYFGDEPYDGPTLNFVELTQYDVLELIPVKATEDYGVYTPYEHTKQATLDALLLMVQNPFAALNNDIERVLSHPRLIVNPNDYLAFLSRPTGEGNQKYYHTIGTSIAMLEMLKRDPEGRFIQVDDALFDKWHDSYLDELRQELQQRRAPAQAVGQ